MAKNKAVKTPKQPTPKDWLAWCVTTPEGFPMLGTVAERRGGAIEQLTMGHDVPDWETCRKQGYRVIRVELTPSV